MTGGRMIRGEYSCGVLNCGGGDCVHELTDEICPCCDLRMVRVKPTGFMFCSNNSLVCDYEKDFPEERSFAEMGRKEPTPPPENIVKPSPYLSAPSWKRSAHDLQMSYEEVKIYAYEQNSPVLYGAIKNYEAGNFTWEMAMQAAAVTLAKQYQDLLAQHLELIQKSPVTNIMKGK